jgi:hypothetical protein
MMQLDLLADPLGELDISVPADIVELVPAVHAEPAVVLIWNQLNLSSLTTVFSLRNVTYKWYLHVHLYSTDNFPVYL